MDKLNKDTIYKINKIIDDNKDNMGPLKLILHKIQHELGYIPLEAMGLISDKCQIPMAEIYGVVTFYTQFTMIPKGKHVVNVCMGTACYVKKSQELLDNILLLTKSNINSTSEDGLFSVDATRCLGACGLAPIAIMDDKVYGNAIDNSELIDQVKDIIKLER